MSFRRIQPVSSRLAPTTAIMAMAFVAGALLAGLSSLLGENYRAEPPFLDPLRAPTRDEAMLIYPAEYALKSTESNDVIFLGDSTCRCSINPAEFQQSSGLSAYNLGSMGTLGVEGYVLILRTYLQHHAKPRAVVLAVTPDDFDVDVSDAVGAWPHLFRWSYGPDRDLALRVPDDLASVKYFARRGVQIGGAYWAEPDVARRFEPRRERLVGGGEETYLTLERKVRQARGYWALRGKHWPGGTDPPGKTIVAVAKQWDPAVSALASLANENDFELIIRLVPIIDSVKTDYTPVRAWLGHLPQGYPRVTVIRPEILLYNVELCWDYQHLNADGVAKFSRRLATDVAAVISRKFERALNKQGNSATPKGA